jgi:peptidoglycan/LPS O-acetylase OafA/YrhL
MPTFHLKPHSRLAPDAWDSLLISLLRGLAALQVAAAHLRAETFPGLRGLEQPPLAYLGLAFVTGFAHQAVVLFFLISGWLVGGSLLDKRATPLAMRLYAIDRVSRLWTVLLPTLVLMLVLAIATDVVDPRMIDTSPANDYSVLSFVGNLCGLQTIAVPNFGGNYALWSLANESWYYLLFPLLLLATGAGERARRLPAIVALLAAAVALPTMLALYFGLWLMGAACSRVRIDAGPLWRALWFALFAGVSVYYRLRGSNDDIVPASVLQDLVYSSVFLVFMASMQLPVRAHGDLLRRGANFLAQFSFTLYVLHVPLIHVLRHIGVRALGKNGLSPLVPLDYLVYAGMLLFILASCYLSFRLFEAHTPVVRRVLKDLLVPAAVRRPA